MKPSRKTAAGIALLAVFAVSHASFGPAARGGEPSSPSLPRGFVRVADVLPEVLLDIRYYSTFNFVGERIDGYNAPVAILSRPTAAALAQAAEAARARGYVFRVFDAYRPQDAADHFVHWAVASADQRNKAVFYPDLEKSRLFEQGYLTPRSGHSRGSAIDLTLVDRRTGQELDMGTPFDFFGEKSHHGTALITGVQAANRAFLRFIMEEAGFRAYSREWWHYNFIDEPYPETYFNFPVE